MRRIGFGIAIIALSIAAQKPASAQLDGPNIIVVPTDRWWEDPGSIVQNAEPIGQVISERGGTMSSYKETWSFFSSTTGGMLIIPAADVEVLEGIVFECNETSNVPQSCTTPEFEVYQAPMEGASAPTFVGIICREGAGAEGWYLTGAYQFGSGVATELRPRPASASSYNVTWETYISVTQVTQP